MPKVTYIQYDGAEDTIDVPLGQSIMQAAMDNNVPGIDADCGGVSGCATCHVLVDADWFALTGEPRSLECSMLSFNAMVEPTSRLSCQIMMTEALDGITVRLPYAQH
jgi:2Fe-2S ferredoxin